MGQSNTFISESTKSTLSLLLQETAKTPKPLTVGRLIQQNRPVLNKILKNGHSYDDVAAVLSDHNIPITGATVEALIPSNKKKKAAKEKAKPPEADTLVTQAQADAIAAEWQRLSEIRKGFTKEELVTVLSDEINQALGAGYNYEDISTLWESKGLTIAASTLRKYHRASKQTDASDPDNAQDRAPDAPEGKAPKPLSQSTKTEETLRQEFAL